MREVVCLCKEIIQLDLPYYYDFDHGETARKLLDGTLMDVTCESCNTTIPTEETAEIKSQSKKWSLLFLPEIKRIPYMSHPKDYKPREQFKEFNFRVVIGYPELLEKVMIWDASLDDKKIELLKFDFLLQQNLSEGPLKEKIDSYRLFFEGTDGEKIHFVIRDLDGKKVGRTAVNQTRYEAIEKACQKNLSPEDLKYLLEEPYVNCNKVKIS